MAIAELLPAAWIAVDLGAVAVEIESEIEVRPVLHVAAAHSGEVEEVALRPWPAAHAADPAWDPAVVADPVAVVVGVADR